MFARVFDTAKRILSRSPSVQAGSSHGRDISPIVPLDNDNKAPMVSTRQGTETTPRSSTKKKAGKRQLESQDTPSQAKRLRKSPPTDKKKLESKSPEPPVSVEDVAQEVEEHESDSAHITTSQHDEFTNVEGLPIRRRTSRKVVVSAPASALEHTTEEDIKGSSDAKTKAEDDQTPSAKNSSGSKKAHKRFGSEEPAEEVQEVPTVAQPNDEQQNDEDYASDSSDEAPEVIATATATSAAKSAQQETERAVKAQAAKEEAKRAKREARVAEEQAQRQLKEEKKAKKLAKKLAKQETAIAKLSLNDDEDGEDIPTESKALPALLPDSLLNAIDEQRPPTPPPEKRGKTAEERRKEKLSHHIKFLERSQRPIKDVKKGKLKVAVLAQQNRVLPPKVNRDTSNLRENWLKGRTEKRIGKKEKYRAGKVERRSHGLKGFIRGED